MRWIVAAGLALASGLPGVALAQEARVARECGDDRGVDRCAEEQQAKVRAALGVRSAEAFAADKAAMLRAFFVDGYGRDQPLVSFVRMPGTEPELIVTVPRDDAQPVELRAPVPVALWEQLVSRGQLFDRALAPRTGDDDPICMHSWVVTVEAVDLSQWRPARARRRTESACGGGLAVAFAFELAEAAIGLLPACAALDPDQHRNTVTRLEACTLLAGDRAAAAQAMNRYKRTGWFAYPDGAKVAPVIAELFFESAELRWPGEAPVRGGRAAALDWATRMEKLRIYPLRFFGETADRVRVEAIIHERPADDTATKRRSARAEMIWTRENGFDFRLRTLTVTPFAAGSD